MALIEVKVPQLSESVAEATLLQWHKKPGDAVSRDENLIDVETDKVVLELPAPEAGVITQVLKGDGSGAAQAFSGSSVRLALRRQRSALRGMRWASDASTSRGIRPFRRSFTVWRVSMR